MFAHFREKLDIINFVLFHFEKLTGRIAEDQSGRFDVIFEHFGVRAVQS